MHNLKIALLYHHIMIMSSRHLSIDTIYPTYFMMKVHAVASSADCNLLLECLAAIAAHVLPCSLKSAAHGASNIMLICYQIPVGSHQCMHEFCTDLLTTRNRHISEAAKY